MGKHSDQLKPIGARVRELRQARGYTLEGFALLVGLDTSYYSKVERGEVNAAIITFVRIAKALDVQVGDLIPAVESLPD